uniref:Reverse transcriptase domain-containing protein n=1 Tax=Triticum aestivum TaxID=4565 RepID=F1C3E6_WHEAT|nr:unknown [Triticum aestivum]
MEEQLAALAKAVNDGRTADEARLEAIQTSLELWRPAVTNLQQQLNELQSQVGRIALHPALADPQQPPVEQVVHGAPTESAGDFEHHGPSGHGEIDKTGGRAHGVVTTLAPPPVKGAYSSQSIIPASPRGDSGPEAERRGTQDNPFVPFAHHAHWALPKMDFPSFDGENPQFWKTKCEKYFDVYGVAPDLWVRLATLNFTGTAARWLQLHETQSTSFTWASLCEALCHKFGREQYQSHLRQFNTLRQSGTVADYMTRFEELMHHILAHNPAFDSVYFTTQFLDGLKGEIRAVVMLHQPKDLDSAFSLATLQEELMEALPRREYKRQDAANQRSPAQRPLLAIGAPPVRQVLPGPPPAAEDRRAIDAANPPDRRDQGRGDDRVAALRNYRRARGLCFKCGERWGQGHQCGPTVQLHVVEELLELLQADQGVPVVPDPDSDEDVLMCISKGATTGQTTPRTVRLLGQIGGQEMLILVDSGSSHSFLSDTVVARLQLPIQAMSTVAVKIADGGTLSCSGVVPECRWKTQGHEFVTDLRVLALGCYDMIVGMDWLESCGPMWIDWSAKQLIFNHGGQQIQLAGVQTQLRQVQPISSAQLCALEEANAVAHIICLHAVGDDVVVEHIPVEVQAVLQEYSVVFEKPTDLPPHRAWDHAIPIIPGAKPVNIRPYRYTPEQKTEIELQVKEMLKAGLIVPSTSPFSSPVLLVKKKDMTWRLCVDYRHLNAITLKSTYPLPVIDELLDELAGSCWFSKMDLRAGYHQIRLREEDEPKTAFTTHQGHFQFRVLPYGVTGGPATFQGGMNTVLGPLLRHGVCVFMDDILTHSATLEGHVELLRQVLSILAQHGLKVKMSKCSFAQRKIDFLGHTISKEGVTTDESKIATVRDWPRPGSVRELRGFLGLAGYYRKFVRNFGVISRPLTDMLKKGTLFIWTPLAETAFAELKQALIQAPVLALPDFNKKFVVETDASAKGVGAVLMQDFHPLAYLSKALAPRNLGLSAYEKECLALILAVDHWRPYLQHAEFLVRTDQKSLLNLTDQRLNTPIQQRAFTKLVGLQFQIQYKAGITNKAADALSRREHDTEAAVAAISICKPAWLEAVAVSYREDKEIQDKMAQIALDPGSDSDYSLKDGVMRYKGRIWIGSDSMIQQSLVKALHDSAVGGHSGFYATYHRIKNLFFWKGMKAQIKQYVKECVTCQRAKTERIAPAGLLQPLPIPKRPWAVISLDFIEGLPKIRRP